MALENMCCLIKSLRLVCVANISCNLDYVAYKLLLINHTACMFLTTQEEEKGGDCCHLVRRVLVVPTPMMFNFPSGFRIHLCTRQN